MVATANKTVADTIGVIQSSPRRQGLIKKFLADETSHESLFLTQGYDWLARSIPKNRSKQSYQIKQNINR